MIPATLRPLPSAAAHDDPETGPPPAFWSPAPDLRGSGAAPQPTVPGRQLPPLPADGPAESPAVPAGSYFRPLPLAVDLPTSSQPSPPANKLPPRSAQPDLPPPPPVSPPDFTDADLREALGPIIQQTVREAILSNPPLSPSTAVDIQQALREAIHATEAGLARQLEPLLRATIRRALAEYAPSSHPFRPPGWLDRFRWHLLALFSNRTYGDIIFEKTHRFQVEEAFLLETASLALVSYASHDPARHASSRRVEGTVKRLAHKLLDPAGDLVPALKLPDDRTALTRKGSSVILVAITRGEANDLLLADLDFSLRRIEDGFRARSKTATKTLLHELQPLLEDCLLIQSPALA